MKSTIVYENETGYVIKSGVTRSGNPIYKAFKHGVTAASLIGTYSLASSSESIKRAIEKLNPPVNCKHANADSGRPYEYCKDCGAVRHLKGTVWEEWHSCALCRLGGTEV